VTCDEHELVTIVTRAVPHGRARSTREIVDDLLGRGRAHDLERSSWRSAQADLPSAPRLVPNTSLAGTLGLGATSGNPGGAESFALRSPSDGPAHSSGP